MGHSQPNPRTTTHVKNTAPVVSRLEPANRPGQIGIRACSFHPVAQNAGNGQNQPQHLGEHHISRSATRGGLAPWSADHFFDTMLAIAIEAGARFAPQWGHIS